MVSSMKHYIDQAVASSSSLSISLALGAGRSKEMCRGADGEFVPNRTTKKTADQKQAHQCRVCGLEFNMGQALGGHMRRRREQELATTAQAQPVLLQLFV
ncbi:hypothetical protein ZWY2020_018703 [Hordeum vulgare]|nr:hypothetical protein ZWY2020_018703 [Hordeum vulgare]